MLLWIDGFESYGTTNGSVPSPVGCLGRRYYSTRDGSSSSYQQIVAGRDSGHAIWLSYAKLTTQCLTSDDTIIVGFAFKITDLADGVICSLLNGNSNFDVKISGTELSLLRGSTTLSTTSGLGLVVDTWYYLELKVVCNDSTGSYELKVNENSTLSDTGIDTRDGADYTRVEIGTPNSGVDVCFDDFYICDSTGSNNNDFLGDCKVHAIRPDGAGNYSDFTPSSGSNYACVNQQESDDDTSYVEDTTGKDSYTYSDLSSVTDIKGIQINTLCKETDAQSFQFKPLIRIDSTDYTGTTVSSGSTGYGIKSEIKETSPDTLSAWTESEINGTEFGLEIV